MRTVHLLCGWLGVISCHERIVGLLVVIHYGDRSVTRIYQCITNNHALFHLW